MLRPAVLLLLLASCAPPPTGSVAGPAWVARVEADLAAERSAFAGLDDALVARAGRDLAVRVGPEGVDLGTSTSGLRLRLERWGREGGEAADAGMVSLGGCASTGAVTPDGTCVARAEVARSGLLEWWEVEGAGLRQGFDVEAPPRGEGALALVLGVEGAEPRLVGPDVELRDSTGRVWSYAGLAAWDADGVDLDAWIEVEGQEVRLVVDDARARYPVTIDPLVTTASASWTGEAAGDELGYGLASLGDVNGDGCADAGVGAPSAGSGTGRVYVYAGDCDTLPATATWSLDGMGAGDAFGATVVGLGDVNGDGLDDFAVGAPSTASGAAAYVYHGTAGGPALAEILMGGGDAGEGDFLAAPGDLNGDGYDDFAFGEPAYDFNTGRVQVWYGGAGGLGDSTPTTLSGAARSQRFGASVAGAGDTNTDGYTDLVVGAPGVSSGAGRAGVYAGSAGGLGTTALRLWTGSGSDALGASVGGLGDVNGDGYADVAVSASGAGTVSVYHGSAGGPAASAARTLSGAVADAFGDVVLGADVHADGRADLVVSAPLANGGAGRVFVYPGSGTGVGGTSEYTLDGPSAGAMFGESVAALDLSGDNAWELLVGAPGTSNGSAWLYLATVDADADGYEADVDCDDNDASVNPGAVDTTGDGIDQNCDGVYLCYLDADDDNVRPDTSSTVVSADDDCTDATEATASAATGDCDDADASVSPRVAETVADGTDQDCDGTELCWLDGDSDGYRPDRTSTVSSPDLLCDAPGEGGSAALVGDCDDSDPSANAGMTEIFGDGVDQDCDGFETCYIDADGDGVRVDDTVFAADLDCSGRGEATPDAPNGDCDDDNAEAYPGAGELAGNGVDEDCDGGEVCYVDADEDSYRPDASTVTTSTDVDCEDPGEASVGTPTGDCDDANSAVNPRASEGPADDVDQDCDGTEFCWLDADADGYRPDRTSTVASDDLDCADPGEADAAGAIGDCDDNDPAIHGGTTEVVGDGVDQDCDSNELCYRNEDGDGYRLDDTVPSDDLDCDDLGEAAPSLPSGDCIDSNATVYPGATDLVADGLDSNCDGSEVCYVDGDDDGFRDTAGTTLTSADGDCADLGEATAAAPDGDCNDADGGVNPRASEIIGNQIDEDCDGVEMCYVDADGDGQRASDGTVLPSTDVDCLDGQEADLTLPDTDCDDTDGTVYQGADEIPADGIDQDCDARDSCYVDYDGDGYRSDVTRANADGDCDDAGEADASDPSGDCNDTNPRISPAAREDAGNGVDENCDGYESCFVDADDDGYRDGYELTLSADGDCGDPGEATEADGLGDCDDNDPTRSPGAREVAADGVDQNCDGIERCYVDADDDGYRSGATLDSADLACDGPGEATSTDGTGDCNDTDATISPGAAEVVGDQIDQDCDGTEICYADADDDGYRPDDKSTVASTDRDCTDEYEAEAVSDAGDCNDDSPRFHPNAVEDDCADPNDYNCDGSVAYQDLDGDGAPACDGDCDDKNAMVYRGASEYCNGIDDNCDGQVDGSGAVDTTTYYADHDHDGYTSESQTIQACTAPDGWSESSAIPDCDDSNNAVHPGGIDQPHDGIDQDCDGTIDNPPEKEGGKVEPVACGCASSSSSSSLGLFAAVAILLARRRRS